MKEMQETFGKDINNWPKIGCMAGFRPCANGPSMVMELLVDGKWIAFISERIPDQIDDCLKKANLAKLEKAFWEDDAREVVRLFADLASSDV